MKVNEISGADLEDKIKRIAILTKPQSFEKAYDCIQILLNEQNRRGRIIAKKYNKTYVNRTVADVFRKYWLDNAIQSAKDIKNETV